MDKEFYMGLTPGRTLYHATRKNADGSRLRARVNGKPQSFRNGWYVPMKYGLKGTFRIGTENRAGLVSREYSNPANWLKEDN